MQGCGHGGEAAVSYKLERQEPELLLDIPDEIVETACAAYWNCALYPGQHSWHEIVQTEDVRVPELRLKMRAALSAAIADKALLRTYRYWILDILITGADPL